MRPNPTVDTSLKTARLITTLKCTRNCSYCANKMGHVKDQMQTIPTKDIGLFLRRYDLVCITGGEPLLEFEKVSEIITNLRAVRQNILIYMYASIWTKDLQFLIPYLDGIHYTIHEYLPFSDYLNTKHFVDSQELFRLYPNKSFRLSLSPDIRNPVPIVPEIWKEIRVKKWFSPEENIVPVHEDLFILK